MKIYFLNGDRTGQSAELSLLGLSIGRETDNDVQLLVGGVSRYHAKIESIGEVWHLRDLGSTNGTKVNGEKISQPVTLKDGDIIMIGDQSIRFGETPSEASSQLVSDTVNVRPASAHDATFKDLRSQIAPEKSATSAGTVSGVSPASEPVIIFNTPGASAPTSAPTPEAEKHASVNNFLNAFKSPSDSTPASGTKIDGDIFGKNKTPSAASITFGKQDESGKGGLFKGKLGNVIFYVAVLAAAVISVAVFISTQNSGDKKPVAAGAAAQSRNDFLLVYEKQLVTRDNIFRFALTVENDSAIFTIDDIKHNRHYQKSFAKVKEVFLKPLITTVKDTDFMKLEQEPFGFTNDGTDESRSLVVAYGDNFNKVITRNSYAQTSFETIEKAISKFAQDCGLPIITDTVEDIRGEAEKAFRNAEDLLENYEANPANLREAIIRYQFTMECLDQFEPKPKEWDISRKKLQEAQSLYKKKVDDAFKNMTVFKNLKKYKEASDEAQRLMDMLGTDHQDYDKIRNYKVTFDKLASTRR